MFAVPLLFASLIQDKSCNGSKSSQSTASSSPVPSASVVMKKGSAEPRPTTVSSPKRLSSGIWGGTHVNLEVSDGESSLEFDCARGSIAEPIILDSDGHFEVHGSYTREGPGPVRQEGGNNQRATYSGIVKDATMTLSIQLDGSSDELLKVTLTQGQQGRLRKCY